MSTAMPASDRFRVAALRPLLLTLLLAAACDRGAPPADGRDAVQARPAADTAASATDGAWPAPGAGRIDVARDRHVDLTGDGAEERVVVTARGSRYDSLDVALRIESPDGTLLWADDWNSSYYFYYDSTEGRSDEEIARVVQEHVDRLVSDERFHAGGMPTGLMGGDPTAIVRESVQYHLAELDWRRGASLEPADPTPPGADRRIRPEHVVPERVRVITDELSQAVTYNYFAGGEATYVIGWSEREQAFVRLFACC